MSDVRKFKFVSPGIFLREIDNSQLPAVAPEVGPVVIGKARQGPAMRPHTVQSFSEFVDVFGAPLAGGGGGDYFRDGNISAPTYGAYAAQAYLDAQIGPVTYVRMLGDAHPNNDATTAGMGGWNTEVEFTQGGQALKFQKGGAYGLFICPSSSTSSPSDASSHGTGSLAAIWYCNSGSTIILSGNARTTGTTLGGGNAPLPASGSCLVVESDSSLGFTAIVLDSLGAKARRTTFNFNRNSGQYIRTAFNTNPTFTNSVITDQSNLSEAQNLYWLGETYESHLFEKLGSNSGTVYGFIAAVNSGSLTSTSAGSNQWADRQTKYINPRTGWFFSQDLTTDTASYDATNMTKLFCLHARDQGESAQEQYKVSIQDIKASTNDFNNYGSFTVVIRAAWDSDAKPVIIERYSECNLDPQSPNYVARKIGDRYLVWDYEDARMREYGEFANKSEIVRIEVNPNLNAADTRLLPFGVFGPPRPPGFNLISGSGPQTDGYRNILPLLGDAGVSVICSASVDYNSTANYSYVEGTSSCAGSWLGMAAKASGESPWDYGMAVQTSIQDSADYRFTGSYFFPSTLTRLSGTDHGMASPKDAYWGLQTNIWSANRQSTKFDPGYRDYLRGLPLGTSGFDTISGPPAKNEYSWIFTLDDIVVPGGVAVKTYWMSGSRNGRSLINTVSAGDSVTSASYTAVLDSGFNRFTSPLYGGFDGFDITEKDPFRDGFVTSAATIRNNYAFNTVKKAIDTVKNPEFVEMNMLSAPGIVNQNLTQTIINTCEDRADALAVIDLRGIYQPFTENADSFQTRVDATSLAGVVTALRDRSINSSYACAHYPWVQIQDTMTGQFLWAPPSVAVMGTLASSERKSEVWFAPAGFNRGGLSKGRAAGIPVTAVTQKLSSSDRDTLYEANINPIASFPSEGIVVFGQKTLQVTPSALDRINVRRLMIFIKKKISRISAGILFDQNVRATWQRFTGQVNPLLASVKARMGLTEFKVVLDETTTTPDLIDRNILYAKIFLKPARAIEFIAIDFNITRTGASFED